MVRVTLTATALAAALGAGLLAPTAGAAPPPLAAPTGVTAVVGQREVDVSWSPYAFPPGAAGDAVQVLRDGVPLATLPASATSFADTVAGTARTVTYVVRAAARRGGHDVSSAPSVPATVTLPHYLVGAATADITPPSQVNLGGFGLGDGNPSLQPVVGRGGVAGPSGARIRSRAIVVGDGRSTVAIADIETQGMFAAYEAKYGAVGLSDIAAQVARERPDLPADHIVIASDHTHHGPDTIGAWGGVGADYLALVKQRTVAAIEQAFDARRYSEIRAGQSDASDLVYNQACTEAVDHGSLENGQYPSQAPDVCPTPGKDGMVRVLQASTPAGAVVATLMVYAAHSTTNMGNAVDGDWPQFLGDHLAQVYGGVGVGMEGANGGTQPCRPTCWFTAKSEPGYGKDRFSAIVANYSAHVADALAHAHVVTGPVAAAQRRIQEPLAGPFVNALFLGGDRIGAVLMRSRAAPWMKGQVVTTVASVVRVGDVLFDGTPGEGFPAIRQGIADAAHEGRSGGPSMVVQLGLANDQLGYLIAPLAYVAPIAAEAAVNDNILFNVSPTIGDHVMCSDIALATQVLTGVDVPASCSAYLAEDAAAAEGGSLRAAR